MTDEAKVMEEANKAVTPAGRGRIMSDTYHAVSLSGGKDSTAMLLMMLERGMQVDEVIFFDTGWEFPAMHDHIALVEERTGIAVTRLRSDKSFEHYMFDHVRTRGAYKGMAGWGWARPRGRWCTKLKTSAIDKHVHALADGREVARYIGIAADEPCRIREFNYPLAEWGVTEAEALAYCQGNIIKYLWRHREKGGTEDLRKAQVYLEWLIEAQA